MFKLRFFLGTPFRLFVLISLMLHVGVGLFLGVPSWERMVAEREFDRVQKEKAKEEVKAAEKAKAAALEETRQAVEKQLHDQFNQLNLAMPSATQEKVWREVASKLDEKTRSLADALCSDAVTEQDLLNLEHQINRDLVEQTDEALADETAQEMAERFIQQVEDQVVPQLARSMHEQVVEKVAAQLSRDADQIVKTQTEGAERESAAKATPEQRPKSLAAVAKVIETASQSIQSAGTAIVGAAAEREQYVRKDLRKNGEGELKKIVEESFAKEFRNETVPRLTPKLVEAFVKELSQNNLKNDTLVKEVAKRTSELLAAKVPALAQAGKPIEEFSQRLAPEGASADSGENAAKNIGQKSTEFDLSSATQKTEAGAAGAAAAGAGAAAGAAQASAEASPASALDQQLAAGKAKMAAVAQQQVQAIVKNESGDAALVQQAIGSSLAGVAVTAMADARDSMSRRVEGMRNGRMGEISGASRLGSLRQGAKNWQHVNGIGSGGYQDRGAYHALTGQIADRGTVKGEEWERKGASGATSHADDTGMGPSCVAGSDNALAKIETGNTEPYKPPFKTLAFASIPCLPGNFVCDGQPGKWEGIPSITLNPEFRHPELGKDLSVQTVQIGWRNDALFFRYTIVNSDHHITKNTVSQFWVNDPNFRS